MYCLMVKLMVFTSCHIVYLRAVNVTKYVSRGRSIVLECQVDSNSKAIWDGPNGENGSIVYADGSMINPKLSNKRKLKLVGSMDNREYNMEIRNISTREEGVYRCSQRNLINRTTRATFVLLLIQVEPKNPQIHGKINGKLDGQEGVHLQLLCTVTSGIPNETITWYNVSSKIDKGGPAILNTTITPSRYDHKKKYICSINHTSLQKPLQEIVTLDIKYAPRMIFKHENPLRINEGNNLTIVCTWNSNPAIMATINKEDKHIKSHCDQSLCTFTLENISRKDNGLYKCSGYNIIGKGQSNISVIVQYPPDINVLLNVENKVVECSPNGIPPNFTFYQWQHRSEYGQLIRSLPDSPILKLDSTDGNIENYQLNGVYECRAENGISDANGTTVRTGKINVLLKDKPRFISPTENIQYGRFGFSIDISVSVYCFPKCYNWSISSTKLCCYNKSNYATIVDYNVTAMIFGKPIQMKGYKIMLTKLIIEEKHFTNYTFSITNDMGKAIFSVKLISRDIGRCGVKANETTLHPKKPEVPTITGIFPGHNSLTITWLRSFNGGAEQQFILAYRKITDEKWRTSLPINDTFDTCCVYILKYLNDDTNYEIRLYSNNSLGRSNFTRVLEVKTLDTAKKLMETPTLILTLFGCFLVITISMLSIFWCHKKGFCSQKETSRLSNVPDSSIQDDMAVENYIYQSQGNGALNQRYARADRLPLDGDADSTAGHYRLNPESHAFNIEEMAVENHIYHSQGNVQVNQHDQQRSAYQHKLSQPGRGEALALEGRIYQNACVLEKAYFNNLGEVTTLYDRGSSVNDLKHNTEILRSTGIEDTAQARDRHELNYAEVIFGDSTSTKASMIHGIHERTIYADIDATAFVKTERDAEDNRSRDSSQDDDDDDFMYVDGIVDYTKKS